MLRRARVTKPMSQPLYVPIFQSFMQNKSLTSTPRRRGCEYNAEFNGSSILFRANSRRVQSRYWVNFFKDSATIFSACFCESCPWIQSSRGIWMLSGFSLTLSQSALCHIYMKKVNIDNARFGINHLRLSWFHQFSGQLLLSHIVCLEMLSTLPERCSYLLPVNILRQ
jgi:hypothetical protein